MLVKQEENKREQFINAKYKKLLRDVINALNKQEYELEIGELSKAIEMNNFIKLFLQGYCDGIRV